jgi:predicted kinase
MKVHINENQYNRLLVEESGDRYNRCGFEMLVGIPGCGKSTYLRSVDNGNIVIVCPDDIRRELTGDISDQSRNSEVWSEAEHRIIDGLNSGSYVILDATNVNTRMRVSLLGRIKGKCIDVPCYATVFDCNPDVSKERISRDIANGVDRSNVPPEVIDRMYGGYLETLEKIKDEGFDDVFFK